MSKALHTGPEFLIITPAEASGQKVPLTAHRKAAAVYIKQLWLTPEQKKQIQELYSAPDTDTMLVDRVFDTITHKEQVAAASLLASEGLDLDGQAALSNHWSSRWASLSGRKGSKIKMHWELFQWCVISFLCDRNMLIWTSYNI